MGVARNLPLEFLTQIDVKRRRLRRRVGGAMGGVINTVLKSGSNQLPAVRVLAPYWLAGNPNTVTRIGGAVGSLRSPTSRTTIASSGRPQRRMAQASRTAPPMRVTVFGFACEPVGSQYRTRCRGADSSPT